MSDDGFPTALPPAGAPGARKGWRCPDEAVLAAWAEGRLPGDARGKLEGHVADCAFCRGQLGFLARAADLGPPPAVPARLLSAAVSERAPLLGRLRPATALAAGAGLLLALLVAAPWPGFPGTGPPDGTRGDSPAAAGSAREVRSETVVDASPRILRPAEGQTVARDALALRWIGTPRALFYTVQVVDADGDVAWEGRAEATSLTVPATAPLFPGRLYFAWVFAHLPSGATVPSPAVGFRLAPG
jgi:hypothetical protein